MMGGGIFMAFGVMPILLTILSGEFESLLFDIMIALIFGLAGFLAGGFLYFVRDWLPVGRISVLIFGLLFCLSGLFAILLVFSVDDESSRNAPPLIVAAIGMIFVMAGLLVMRLPTSLPRPKTGYDLCSLFTIAIMLTCFAVVAVWVVIGGRQEGLITVSLPFLQISVPGQLAIGHPCFLPWAILVPIVAGKTWWDLFKRIIDRRKEDL